MIEQFNRFEPLRNPANVALQRHQWPRICRDVFCTVDRRGVISAACGIACGICPKSLELGVEIGGNQVFWESDSNDHIRRMLSLEDVATGCNTFGEPYAEPVTVEAIRWQFWQWRQGDGKAGILVMDRGGSISLLTG